MERPVESLVGVSREVGETRGGSKVQGEGGLSMFIRTLTLRLNMSVTVSGIVLTLGLGELCDLRDWYGVRVLRGILSTLVLRLMLLT